MDWRREDLRYAIATIAAVGFVSYLVVGNFGLVPSPLPGVGADNAASTVPVLAVPTSGQTEPEPDGTGPLTVPVVAPVQDTSPPSPTASPPTPAPDRTAPEAVIQAPADGFVGSFGGAVQGRATDDRSGIDRVVVRFVRDTGASYDVRATLDCDGTRRACSWTAVPNENAGTYDIEVRAVDREGNIQDPPDRRENVTILTSNAGPNDGTGGVFGSLVGAVGGLLGGAGSLFGL